MGRGGREGGRERKGSILELFLLFYELMGEV